MRWQVPVNDWVSNSSRLDLLGSEFLKSRDDDHSDSPVRYYLERVNSERTYLFLAVEHLLEKLQGAVSIGWQVVLAYSGR